MIFQTGSTGHRQLDYSDVFHFSRRFKTAIGETPTRYRVKFGAKRPD
ncbi:helix-turn-helix transcriptional regulator [Victivallis sp. Marseille-Q1083]|nr:helix-turn-helix transcriptional regulator [Victivallis sp. Marseille-Q1083]